MSKPTPIDDDDAIWHGTVDGGKWIAQVRPAEDDNHMGRLLVWPADNTEQPILDEEVPLIHGAIFGPDIDDVAQWQYRAIQAIDAQ